MHNLGRNWSALDPFGRRPALAQYHRSDAVGRAEQAALPVDQASRTAAVLLFLRGKSFHGIKLHQLRSYYVPCEEHCDRRHHPKMQKLLPERRQCSPSAAFLVAAAFAAATLFHSDAVRAEAAMVKLDKFTFAPQILTVKAGTTVTWRNEDNIPHTVASAARVFKSKVLNTGDSFSFTFTEPGSYEYFCSLHPHMTGKIVVDPANQAAK